jgi:hypothetical protein
MRLKGHRQSARKVGRVFRNPPNSRRPDQAR